METIIKKNKIKSNIFTYCFLFYFYGATYVTIEVFFREHSHWTMFLLGAICGLIIGKLNEFIPWEKSFFLQCLIGATIITIMEFIWGYFLNIKLGLNLWDYSNLWGNFKGQICPLFSVCWFFLSGIGIILDDYLKYWFFSGEKPYYKI